MKRRGRSKQPRTIHVTATARRVSPVAEATHRTALRIVPPGAAFRRSPFGAVTPCFPLCHVNWSPTRAKNQRVVPLYPTFLDHWAAMGGGAVVPAHDPRNERGVSSCEEA